jgi:predicted MFS family arabinose efflux permease
LGGAVIGGGLYYNVTMPMTARFFPRHRATAFSVLTLLGALASPIFYTLAAWLVDLWGWRGGLQALIAVTVLCVAPAALLIRATAATPARDAGEKDGVGALLRRPAIHRVLVVFAFAGLANSAVLHYQVSALQATGLTLAAASGFAGVRGFFQIPGRLLLTPLVARFGVRGAMGGCYAMAGTAMLALMLAFAVATPPVFAGYYAVIGGMALGLLSPLGGLFQTEVYSDARLGALSGVGVVVSSVAAAAGAWLAGLVVDATGPYAQMLAMATLLQTLAVVALVWQRAAGRGGAAVPAPAPGGGG